MIGMGGIFALIGSGFVNELAVILLIFFLVLPMINGVVDWASWWVTRRLGAHLLAAVATSPPAGGFAVSPLGAPLDGARAKPRSAMRLAGVALGHGVVDLVVATLMLLGMALTLAFGFEVYNQLAAWQGKPVFDVARHIAEAAAAPFTEGAWLSLMLLTTLVPTLLHLVVVLMSPLGVLFISDRRERWAVNLENWDALDEATRSRTRRGVANWLARGRFGLWVLALVLATLLFGGLLAAFRLVHQGGFADLVAEAALTGVHLANGLAGILIR